MNSAAASSVTLYHHRRARIERARGLSHLVPALVLLSGVGSVLGGSEKLTGLLLLELVVGVAYVALLARELYQLRRHGPAHHERVAWLELAAAGILALEGYHIWHRHHETALRTGEHGLHVLPWFYWAVAAWYVAMAFGIAKLHQRRFLHLHPTGFRGRVQLFGPRFEYVWANVRRLEPVSEADVIVHGEPGESRRLSFKNVHDGPAHRNRLLAAAEAANLSAAEAPALPPA